MSRDKKATSAFRLSHALILNRCDKTSAICEQNPTSLKLTGLNRQNRITPIRLFSFVVIAQNNRAHLSFLLFLHSLILEEFVQNFSIF